MMINMIIYYNNHNIYIHIYHKICFSQSLAIFNMEDLCNMKFTITALRTSH